MGGVRTWVFTLALAASALGGPGGAAANHYSDPAIALPSSLPWGFNEDWGYERGVWSPEATGRHLALATQIIPDGVSTNRLHVEWARVERRKDHYDWERTDKIYNRMVRYSDQPLMMVYNAPEWARKQRADCPSEFACAYPPRKRFDRDWMKFVRAAARRYPEIRALEVWNEPNLGRFWAPKPKVSRYVDILDRAHEGISKLDSSIPVLTGGMIASSNNEINISSAEFLRRVYTQGDVRDFDGIGSHPYPWTPPYVEQFTKWLDKLRAVRDQAGDRRTKLWITEIGISSDPISGASLEEQGLIVDLYRSVVGHDIGVFVIHRLHDISYEGPFWSQTGVVTESLEPKPVYCSLADGIGTIVGACTVEPATPPAEPVPPEPEPVSP